MAATVSPSFIKILLLRPRASPRTFLHSTALDVYAYCITENVLSGSGFQYVGCFGGVVLSAILNYYTTSATGCLSQCQQAGFSYCGLEFGTQCRGSQSMPSLPSLNTTSCNTFCADGVSYCGGNGVTQLYQNTTTTISCASPDMLTVDSIGRHAYCITENVLSGSGFQYVGCVEDGVLPRILNYCSNSVADCLSQCQQAGLRYWYSMPWLTVHAISSFSKPR